jgi:hypothetical protein
MTGTQPQPQDAPAADRLPTVMVTHRESGTEMKINRADYNEEEHELVKRDKTPKAGKDEGKGSKPAGRKLKKRHKPETDAEAPETAAEDEDEGNTDEEDEDADTGGR